MIINDIPFPTPLAVIWSPSHNKKAVPAVNITEYCNFGCSYFVLKKIGKAPQLVDSSKEMIEAVEEDIILIEETDTPQLDESNLENDLEQQKNIEQGQF